MAVALQHGDTVVDAGWAMQVAVAVCARYSPTTGGAEGGALVEAALHLHALAEELVQPGMVPLPQQLVAALEQHVQARGLELGSRLACWVLKHSQAMQRCAPHVRGPYAPLLML